MAVQFAVEHKRTSEYRFYPEDITIKPDLNGRHEKPEIEWLITDILAHGQHTPVVIRNDGGEAVLVAGFSRWRAISEINKRWLAPVRLQVRCTYVQCSEGEAFLINISENRFRNPATPLDDAHNIKRLLNVYQMTDEQVAGVYFPTAKTEGEIKTARKFVKDRIALISLSEEAAEAVKSGRVKESAAVAIAKLSEAQQHEILKKEGTIGRSDVKKPGPPKAPKPVARYPELMRRVTAALEDVAGMLADEEYGEFIEVDRKLLLDLYLYVEEIKPKAAAAA
jgi:ParB/RepB/Spo0J family partition protein